MLLKLLEHPLFPHASGMWENLVAPFDPRRDLHIPLIDFLEEYARTQYQNLNIVEERDFGDPSDSEGDHDYLLHPRIDPTRPGDDGIDWRALREAARHVITENCVISRATNASVASSCLDSERALLRMGRRGASTVQAW